MTGFMVGAGKVQRQWKLHAIKPCFVGVKRHLFLQPTLLSCLDKRTNRKFSLPLNVSEPGGVPESFGKRIAVYFQLGYLGRKKWVQNDLISEVNETKPEVVFFISHRPQWSCKHQD